MSTVLIIEDEADLRAVLEYNLRRAGHAVRACARGSEGLDQCRARPPDLILLDLMLPDTPGTEVCKAIRQDPALKTIPIIMLTAKSEEVDRVVGFELGADDYVTKPFSMRELVLRIQSILRRAQPELEPTGVVVFGRLRVDKGAHRTWVDDREIELTSLELRLLLLLHERKNRVQSRETLLEDVWGMDSDVTSRTVDTHVKRLREKLGPASAYLRTVRGAGYRFAETPDEAED
ncbi:MAG: response regulator transcription factor [Deltaproteobacteria bacterium]|nr:response regulator transcription factor [Deltaproteobacteria bacterium]